MDVPLNDEIYQDVHIISHKAGYDNMTLLSLSGWMST